jgi:hypothetical protein
LNSYQNILTKLEQFTKKYYTKMLLKGALFFLAFGVLFFLVILGVEYLLWLNSSGRLLLLFLFIAIEFFLLFRYILTPLFLLFKIKKGISNIQASILIGRHFPDVGDKLLNLLDLAEESEESELLLASIQQRSENLNPIPFAKAVDFKENIKYAKYLVIPAVLFGLIWLSGNLSAFFGSYNRVVNYDVAYEPPAPFSFKLISDQLNVLDSKAVTVQVVTEGEIRPDQVFIMINDRNMLLQEQNGIYQYTFTPPLVSVDFSFRANGIFSREYRLNALKTPSIQNFKLVLDYPNYTKRKSETLKSTGNATFPEGTKVSWQIEGRATGSIRLITKDTAIVFVKEENRFRMSKQVYTNFTYQIRTSNQNVADYERLEYRFDVIKDAYPAIKVKQVLDSLNLNTSYYIGEASDDYALKNIRLVFYADGNPDIEQTIDLATPNSNFNQFYYTFPSGLQLDAGKSYSFYFSATDNDAIHEGKTTKSQVFSTIILDENQLKNKELESQQAIIQNLDKSLEKFVEQKETLKEINKEQKEKKHLNFNDQNRIKDFLKKQLQQEYMMQKFSKQLKENLDISAEKDEISELLKERLERQEIEAKKNEKLLEELNKIADKIDKEELTKRLEEIAKKQQNSERNLEQLLELTKRYYVTEKSAQLAKDLEKLAELQEQESEKSSTEGKSEEQEKLSKNFEKLTEELSELKKDNADLKKPLELNISAQKVEGVKNDQKDATEELNKEKTESSSDQEKKEAGKKASQRQKAAAQKMKEMSDQLQESSSGGSGGSSITEDAEMLRQILDNLVTFSFKQENLYEDLEDADPNAPQFSSSIRQQQELRKLFEHVDDSLFALSLRRAELSEFVNEQITEIYYSTDKALEAIAESQIYLGVSYQKYVLTASNNLSDFLANTLDNMQESMQSGKEQGGGKSFQLPDIIKGQGELKEKMKGMGQSGQGKPQSGKGEQGEGKKGKGQEESGKEGQGGKKGEGGKDGEGEGNGSQGGEMGSSNQPSEEELKEIYEIYKEQQLIRAMLEEQLQDMINTSDRKLGQKLARQMEEFENELLENGITQHGLNKLNTIQYELLKLEKAAMKQGKKPERESSTNKDRFSNPIRTKPSLLEDYRNDVEILNRQALPLRQNFQNKVKEYFESND